MNQVIFILLICVVLTLPVILYFLYSSRQPYTFKVLLSCKVWNSCHTRRITSKRPYTVPSCKLTKVKKRPDKFDNLMKKFKLSNWHTIWRCMSTLTYRWFQKMSIQINKRFNSCSYEDSLQRPNLRLLGHLTITVVGIRKLFISKEDISSPMLRASAPWTIALKPLFDNYALLNYSTLHRLNNQWMKNVPSIKYRTEIDLLTVNYHFRRLLSSARGGLRIIKSPPKFIRKW